jgi:hypothetical protein
MSFKKLSSFKNESDADACISHRRARDVCVSCGIAKPLVASDFCASCNVASSIESPTPESTVGDGTLKPFKPHRRRSYFPQEGGRHSI